MPEVKISAQAGEHLENLDPETRERVLKKLAEALRKFEEVLAYLLTV